MLVRKRFEILWVFLVVFLVPGFSAAEVGYTPGFGIMSSNIFKITGSETGSMSLIGDLDFYGYHKLKIGDSSSLAFVPMVGLTTWFLTGSTADDGSNVLRFHMGIHFEKQVSSSSDLHFGTGILWHRVSGDGQTLTLPNGNSTADFYAPAGESVARMLFLDIGIKLSTTSETGAFFNLMLIDPLSNRRTVALVISLERGDY
jgi:hypothetical protein